MFIDRPLALSRSLIQTGYDGCVIDTLPKPKQPLSVFLSPGGGYNALSSLPQGGVLASGVSCTDCRDRGTIVKPSYWP